MLPAACRRGSTGALAQGRRCILLDLERLSNSVTGDNLRVMIAAAARLKAAGGALALCSPNAQVRRVLEMGDLDRTLPHFADREMACDWLKGTVHRERVARLATRLLRRNERKQPVFRMEKADFRRATLAAKLLLREASAQKPSEPPEQPP